MDNNGAPDKKGIIENIKDNKKLVCIGCIGIIVILVIIAMFAGSNSPDSPIPSKTVLTTNPTTIVTTIPTPKPTTTTVSNTPSVKSTTVSNCVEYDKLSGFIIDDGMWIAEEWVITGEAMAESPSEGLSALDNLESMVITNKQYVESVSPPSGLEEAKSEYLLWIPEELQAIDHARRALIKGNDEKLEADLMTAHLNQGMVHYKKSVDLLKQLEDRYCN